MEELKELYPNAEITQKGNTLEMDLPFAEYANKSNVEVRLLIHARMTNIRTDQDITLKFNAKGNDEITLESAESPLDISGLKPKMRINSIYVTTGANDTEIKIMAFG